MTLSKDGNLGIGTSLPLNKLHIADGDNTTIRIGPVNNIGTAINTTEIGLIRSTYSIGFSGYRDQVTSRMASKISSINKQTFNDVTDTWRTQSSDLAFYTTIANQVTSEIDSGTEKMRIRDNGNVGIGTSDPQHKLDVNGTIKNSGGVVASSDRRIKTDIVDVEDDSALQLVRRLKPKTYTYRDTNARGTEPVYGFIAQEVREVLNYSTSLSKDAVPNIYENANLVEDILTFTTFNTADLVRDVSGDLFTTLRIKTPMDSNESVTILEVIDEHTLKVDLSKLPKDASGQIIPFSQPFVFGQEVNDFHNLNKDVIWTVSTAALQEVDRQLQAEKQKVLDLQSTVSYLQQSLATVLSRLDILDKRTVSLPEPAPEPVSEPASEPVAEPVSEPVAEPAAEPAPEPASEPVAEPASEPVAEPVTEPAPEPATEPVSGPVTEPAPEPASEPVAEPASEHVAEPVTEPAPEPATEPVAGPVSEPAPEPAPEPVAEPAPEPVAEPVTEPATEPATEPVAEPSSEPVAEPVAEPASEPAAEPAPIP